MGEPQNLAGERVRVSTDCTLWSVFVLAWCISKRCPILFALKTCTPEFSLRSTRVQVRPFVRSTRGSWCSRHTSMTVQGGEPQKKKTRGAYAHRVGVHTPVETHILRD